MIAIPSETFDWIDTPLGMTGIQHFSQHIDRTESACIRWILAIGFATMMGPWLHTSQDVRPPPAPSPQSAGGLAFHQLGKRSSRFCIEDLFCARWGQAGAVEKKMKHPFFPTKHVFFFPVLFPKQRSRSSCSSTGNLGPCILVDISGCSNAWAV